MTEVVRVSFGRYAKERVLDEDRSIADDRPVWAVSFTGEITICPPSPHPCEAPRPATATVFLDYFTGAFLATSTLSPGPRAK